jgi:hypothetical protein
MTRTQRARAGIFVQTVEFKRRDEFIGLAVRYYELGARRRKCLEPRLAAAAEGFSPEAISDLMTEASRRARPR